MEILMKHSHKLFWVLPILLVIGILIFCYNTRSEETVKLHLSPKSSPTIVGNNLEVVLEIDSEVGINAIEATINFPTDKLSVVSISKENSFIDLWTAEPYFSNTDGRISFSGGVLNPGFQGEGGRMLSIIFQTKTASLAKLDFSRVTVLANDGMGTVLLTKNQSEEYLITSKDLPDADLNRDGKVGIGDISILLTRLGSVNENSAKYDLNQDGKINLTDISIMLSEFGRK